MRPERPQESIITCPEAAPARLERAAASTERVHVADDTAGDPVCWLDKVCPTCGLLPDTDDLNCPRCGDAMPTD